MLTLRNKVTVIKIIMMNPCVFVLMTITLLAICSSAAVVKVVPQPIEKEVICTIYSNFNMHIGL